MMASWRGHHSVVRSLLEGGAAVNAKSYVRNQMMMMIVAINDEDRDVCR